MGADADTLRASLANANRYAMTSWWDKAAGPWGLDRTRTPVPNPTADLYYMRFHYQPLNYFEPGVEVGRASTEALMLAISLKLGAYNEGQTSLPGLNDATPATTPVTAATARGRTIRLIESLAILHRVNAGHYGLTAAWGSDPTQPNPSWGSDPNVPEAQSAEWNSSQVASYVALAAWLLWDDPNFSDAGRDQVRELIIYEADALLSYDMEWYREAINNTTAEEMALLTTVLQVATVMLPTHPHAQQWMRRDLEYMIGAFGRPQDLTPVPGADPLHGRPVSDWLEKRNLFDTGLVYNTGYSPDYQVSLIHTAQSLLAYGFAGEAMPKGALFNADAMYAALVNHEFHRTDERCSVAPCTATPTPCVGCNPTATPCPTFSRFVLQRPDCFQPVRFPTQYAIYNTPVVPPAQPTPTATAYPYYIPGSSAIYYPMDLWWGWRRRAQYALFDALARSDTASGVPLGLGFDKTATVPAPTWEARHAGEVLAMQQRHLTPTPSTTPDGRIFEVCPILDLCLPDPHWALERIGCESRSDEEEFAAYKIAQAYASRWLLDQRKYAQSNLPYEWRELDLGSRYPAPAGGTDEAYGVYTVQSAGTGLGATGDNLHFVYQPWSGDGEITARIRSFDTPDADARAGITLRDSLAAAAPFVLLAFVPADDSFELRVRGSVEATAAAQGRHWMKLVRSGSVFRAFLTDTPGDVTSWDLVGTTTVGSIGTDAFAGLVVASGDSTELHTATFDDVHLSPYALPISGGVLANRYNAVANMTPAVPGFTRDSDPNTSWVAVATPGTPGATNSPWLIYDLGGDETISSVGINWPKGSQRYYRFAIEVAPNTTGTPTWTAALPQQTSTGKGWAEEYYSFTPVAGRWVRVLGEGWTEVHTATPSPTSVLETATPTPTITCVVNTPTRTPIATATNTPTHSVTPQWVWESSMAAVNIYGLYTTPPPDVTPNVLASTYNTPAANDPTGNRPENTIDNDPDTHWYATGPNNTLAWIRYDLGRLRPVSGLTIQWVAGFSPQHFNVDLSSDGRNWQQVLANATSTPTPAVYAFSPDYPHYARYVRISTATTYDVLAIAEVSFLPDECYAVEWTDRVGVTALGNTLWQSGTYTGQWDHGAGSVRSLTSGTGYVIARAVDPTLYKMFGLGYYNANPTYADLDFAAELMGTSGIRIHRAGSQIAAPVYTYGTNDVFRVAVAEVSGTPVYRWYKNATLLHTDLTPTVTYPLSVDTTFFSAGAQVADVYLCGANVATPTPVPTDCAAVEWTDLVGVTATGNRIQRVATPQGWDAGAQSVQYLNSGTGYVEARAGSTEGWKAFGLGTVNSDASHSDIEYLVELAQEGTVRVYTSGTHHADPTTYVAGDVFRVALEEVGDTNNKVVWYKNGVAFYTITNVTPDYPYHFDSSIYTPDASIIDAYICGTDLETTEAGERPAQQPSGPATKPKDQPQFTPTPTITGTPSLTPTVTPTWEGQWPPTETPTPTLSATPTVIATAISP